MTSLLEMHLDHRDFCLAQSTAHSCSELPTFAFRSLSAQKTPGGFLRHECLACCPRVQRRAPELSFDLIPRSFFESFRTRSRTLLAYHVANPVRLSSVSFEKLVGWAVIEFRCWTIRKMATVLREWSGFVGVLRPLGFAGQSFSNRILLLLAYTDLEPATSRLRSGCWSAPQGDQKWACFRDLGQASPWWSTRPSLARWLEQPWGPTEVMPAMLVRLCQAEAGSQRFAWGRQATVLFGEAARSSSGTGPYEESCQTRLSQVN